MELSKKDCRCCGNPSFERLSNTALVDPFFARYGLQIHIEQKIDVPLYDWGLRRKIDLLPTQLARSLHKALDRLRSKHLLTTLSVSIPYGLCSGCHFLAPWYEIGDDQLSDYYAYYLKKEYKEARSFYQPGFAELGQVMGSVEEATSRREQHRHYVLPYLEELRQAAKQGVVRLLDYGGGEGLIIPDLPWIQGSVHEVEPDQSGPLNQEEGFDFVQCLHVLEHLGNPLHTYRHLINQCRKGGLIYIEVPMEFPGMDAIQKGQMPQCHEHINKFCIESIEALQQACGVQSITVEYGEVDFLHLDGITKIIRGLARKN